MVFSRYLWIGLRQLIARQSLGRTPETSAISSGALQSEHYGQVLKTPMALVYGLALEQIRRNAPRGNGKLDALELCSGPGVFSVLAAQALGLRSLLGVDLSEAMLDQARSHARRCEIEDRVVFRQADVMRVASDLAGRRFDLVLFMNGAHHLKGPESVRTVIRQAEALCAEEGLVFVLDPVRPASQAILEDYVATVYSQYQDLRLTEFRRDFEESLHASYTIDEFGQLVPPGTNRKWFHVKPGLVPATQMLIGLPRKRARNALRMNFGTPELSGLIPPALQSQFALLKFDFWWRSLWG